MKKPMFFGAIFLISASGPTFAEIEYGTWESSSGIVQVEEDITTKKYPKHFVMLEAQEGSSSAGSLILRCKNNKTEVYYTAGNYNFFGAGRAPQVYVRYPSQQESRKQSASSSSDNKAAFFRRAIGFIVDLATEGSVVISGSYYSGSFAAKYKLDEVTLRGVYDMAETCGWVGRLPSIDTLSYAAQKDEGKQEESLEDSDASNTIRSQLEDLVSKYGKQSIIEVLDDM